MPLKKGKSSQIISKNIQKLKKRANPIGRLWPLHYKQQKARKKGDEKQKIGIILLTANFVMPYHAGTKKKKQ